MSPSGDRGSSPPDTLVSPPSPSSTPSSNRSSQTPLTPEETAFWHHLRGRYGYRDNRALRVSLGNLSVTQHSLITYLHNTPTASPGQLAQHIRENPTIQLNLWKPGSRLLERCSPPHHLSGYYCDALLKEHRHSSNWDPRYLGTLDLTDGDHRFRLLLHIRSLLHLSNLTEGFRAALTTAADWLTRPTSHNDVSTLSPWQLLWSREAASPEQPYTWFTMTPEFARHTLAGSDPSAMAGWAVLTTDTRYDDTCDFSYSSLAAMLDQPNYGLWSPDWCIPLKPPLTPHGDLPAMDWALHSLCGLILETWQQTHYTRYRPPPLRRLQPPSTQRSLPSQPPPCSRASPPRTRTLLQLSGGSDGP